MADRLAMVLLVIMIAAVAWRVLSSVYRPHGTGKGGGGDTHESASPVRENPAPPGQDPTVVKSAPVVKDPPEDG